MTLETFDLAEAERQLKAGKRLLKVKKARGSMLDYMQLQMPDPEDVEDSERSRYVVTPLARMLSEIIEKVDKGELKRVAVSVGPQMGKSQVLSRFGPAWLSGRDPFRNLMLGSYNQDFANDFGAEVRDIIQSQSHRQVFDKHHLKTTSVDHQVTVEGGQLNFIGVGGSGTGKPADFFFVDDPIRNDDDAQSETYRERMWKWFNAVALTRCHSGSAIVVVHTRWHQDDLIGRLCDPDHPERNGRYKGIADRWTYINLPAVVEDPKLAQALGLELKVQTDPLITSQFGEKPITSIWPGRKDLDILAEAKMSDQRVFGALYMGEPSPEDGEFFTRDMLVEYDARDLPEDLRYYAASDHAVSLKQQADPTCMGVVGVDSSDNIWVLPDLVWGKMQTDKTVEEIIRLMRTYSPDMWWMESELISKSFGPFLRKRMNEERLYTYVKPVTVTKDKLTRARAMQGRMSMRKVHFPRFAPWWPQAQSQLLKFPFATHDDFVDFLSHVGLGLGSMIAADRMVANDNGPRSGTIEWILRRTALAAQKEKRKVANDGW